MKIPKKFVYFITVAQAILTLSHWLLYACILFFFPSISPYRHILLWVLLVLSFSFILFSLLEFNSESYFVSTGYLLSGIWVTIWFYLLLAAAAASIVFLISSKSYPYLTSAFFILGLAICAYGVVNARTLRTIKITVKLPNLPGYWKGKTAVMVSDLHLGHVLRGGFAKKIIAKINQLNPEVVFIPGDFYDGAKTDFSGLANLFKQVKAPQGIYFCSGNHEMFAGYKECEDALSGAGIKILENTKVEINGLQIAGASYDHNKIQDIITDFKNILQGLLLDKNKPSILLKHVPLQIDEVRDAGISLQLSGHTHRGQIWPGSLITKKVFKGFDYGLKRLGDLQIYISSGAGTWGPPVRIGTKSEIIKITFE